MSCDVFIACTDLRICIISVGILSMMYLCAVSFRREIPWDFFGCAGRKSAFDGGGVGNRRWGGRRKDLGFYVSSCCVPCGAHQHCRVEVPLLALHLCSSSSSSSSSSPSSHLCMLDASFVSTVLPVRSIFFSIPRQTGPTMVRAWLSAHDQRRIGCFRSAIFL